MASFSLEADKLIREYTERVLPYNPEVVADVLRKNGEHLIADLFESLTDQIQVLEAQVKRLERRSAMPRPKKRK